MSSTSFYTFLTRLKPKLKKWRKSHDEKICNSDVIQWVKKLTHEDDH